LILLASPVFSSPEMLGIAGKIAVFFYMSIIGGFGGVHFPLAVSFTKESDARRAGVFYGVDLLGASCGTLVVGLLALPLIGIPWTALGMIWLNLLAWRLIRK
jgi:predicted membrane-bound spermidine synthase